MAEEGRNINMNLTVRIHEKEYKNVAQGVTFTEEFNETLDSAVVRLPHVIGQIQDLRPYDDVYIYESGPDDDDTYFYEHIVEWRNGGELHNGDKGIPFYRHFLVDTFSEEVINLSQDIYSYSLELFSETKGLEVVQCPNISITNPLNAKKRVDIYTYLQRFLELYSPKYKKAINNEEWEYAQKYTVAPELESIFGGICSQDFTLSNPNLRDVLSTLMITKDMIPYIKDDKLYAKDLSKRRNEYDMQAEKDSGRISRIVGQMGSSDYCDGVRRQYSQAVSQDGICHFVEYMGFRNKNQAVMGLGDMRLETTHPIYNIDKIYMYYYKQGEAYYNHKLTKILILCKQDITPLIKLKSEWDLLSQDWRDLEDKTSMTLADYAKYKLTTCYYSIGGNTIDGWGTQYQQYKTSGLSIWDETHTYIENIVKILESLSNHGIISDEEYSKYLLQEQNVVVAKNGLEAIYHYGENKGDPLSNVQNMKTVFFEIEYRGFYEGALVHSRDNGRDNIISNDNVSSSLTLLEKDGVAQKAKLNRFANKAYTMKGRLEGDNYSVSKLLNLGDFCAIGNDDDVIIYRREYSIFDNYISVSYAGIQSYVLKNYYTSVYAKYRTNQLASYGESITRAETRKVFLLLSTKKKYKDENDTFFNIKDKNGNDISVQKALSAFLPNDNNDNINTAFIENTALRGKRVPIFVDCNTFYSNNMLCFNIVMPDNISGGNSIVNWANSSYTLLYNMPSEDSEYYKGSTQQWERLVDDENLETGFVNNMSFIFSNKNFANQLVFIDDNDGKGKDNVQEVLDYSKRLPGKTDFASDKQIIKNEFGLKDIAIYKDNKEKINMTYVVEFLSDQKNDIVFGDRFISLSNLLLSDNILKRNITEKNTVFEEASHIATIRYRVYGEKEYGSLYYVIPITLDFPETTESIDDFVFAYDAGIDHYFSGEIHTNYQLPSSQAYTSLDFSATAIYWDTRDYNYIHESIVNQNKTVLVVKGKGVLTKVAPNGDTTTEELTELIFWWFNKHSGDGFRADRDGYYYTIDIRTTASSEGKKTYVDYHNLTLQDTKKRSLTIEQNMFCTYSTAEIDSSYSDKFEKYGESGDKNIELFKGIQLEQRFPIEIINTKNGDSRIRVDVSFIDLFLFKNIKSIQFWYLDYKSAYKTNYSGAEEMLDYTPSNSGYYFVFGINLNENTIHEEDGKKYVDIYISKISNRDDRVYDGNGCKVGIVENCLSGKEIISTELQKHYYIKNAESQEIGGALRIERENLYEDEYEKITGCIGRTYALECDCAQFISWAYSKYNPNGALIESGETTDNPYTYTFDENETHIALKLNINDVGLSDSIEDSTVQIFASNINAVNVRFDTKLLIKVKDSSETEERTLEYSIPEVLSSAEYKNIFDETIDTTGRIIKVEARDEHTHYNSVSESKIELETLYAFKVSPFSKAVTTTSVVGKSATITIYSTRNDFDVIGYGTLLIEYTTSDGTATSTTFDFNELFSPLEHRKQPYQRTIEVEAGSTITKIIAQDIYYKDAVTGIESEKVTETLFSLAN